MKLVNNLTMNIDEKLLKKVKIKQIQYCLIMFYLKIYDGQEAFILKIRKPITMKFLYVDHRKKI